MSDISIPGVKSKYETEKIVEGLMKLERVPKDRAEERLKAVQEQRSTWLDLNRRFGTLRESSRSLYSFQNPFNERSAASSDESVLTASATRDAAEETKSFVVKRTAAADRLMSDPLPESTKAPAGSYVFTVGEASVKLSFGGGSLKDLVDAINRRGGETIRAQLVNVKADERVLVIESLKTGSANRLGFSDAAEAFALSAGLVEKASSRERELGTSPARFEAPLNPAAAKPDGDSLLVGPRSEAALRMPTTVPASGLVLEFQVELRDLPGGATAEEGPPPGPAFPSTGAMEYEGIRIESAPSEASLPAWSPPPKPPVTDDFSPLYVLDGSGRAAALAPLKPGEGYATVTVPLSSIVDSFSGLGVRNGNTGREVRIKGARVYDPTEVAGLRAKKPVDTARDAVVLMDGIEVTRPSNTIDDLVPGLSLKLWNASDDPVRLKVEPNRELVKEKLIELVGNYNRLMAELNVLGRDDEKILTEIDYLSADEKKTYEERLGLFQGDMTLSQLRTNLQRTMMDPYPTSGGLDQLAAFGISTDSRKGGSYDASRLRGYLEIDEASLDKALAERFQRVKEAFGYDTDGDLLIDAGVAFKLDNLMKAYVETGGIVTIRTRTLDDQISRQKKEIDTLETQLARKEADLKRKYGLMESALGQMESTSSAWDNFNTSQGK